MSRPCQDCIDAGITGCQCSFIDSETIAFTGSGDAGDSFVSTAIVSTDANNRLEARSSGLYVPELPWIRSIADTDQDRATGDAIAFNANEPHGDQTMHLAPYTDHYYWAIPITGLWELTAQVFVKDAGGIDLVSVLWKDSGSVFYSEEAFYSIPCAIQVTARSWIAAGTHVQLIQRWVTGAGPATISGGTNGDPYETDTWAYLECRKAAAWV